MIEPERRNPGQGNRPEADGPTEPMPPAKPEPQPNEPDDPETTPDVHGEPENPA